MISYLSIPEVQALGAGQVINASAQLFRGNRSSVARAGVAGIVNRVAMTASIKLIRGGKANITAKISLNSNCKISSKNSVNISANGIMNSAVKLVRQAKSVCTGKSILVANSKVLHRSFTSIAAQTKISAIKNITSFNKVNFKTSVGITANSKNNRTASVIMTSNVVGKFNGGFVIYLTANLKDNASLTASGSRLIRVTNKFTGVIADAVINAVVIPAAQPLNKTIIDADCKITAVTVMTPHLSRKINAGVIIITATAANRVQADAMALWKILKIHVH